MVGRGCCHRFCVAKLGILSRFTRGESVLVVKNKVAKMYYSDK